MSDSTDERDLPAVAADLLDYWTPLMLHTVVANGILAAFGKSARTPGEVAAETGCDADTLRRVLRALTSRGIFEERSDGTYAVTPLGTCFLPDPPGSVAAMARDRAWDLHAWAEFHHTLFTGEPAFPAHFGMTYFDYLGKEPEASAVFNRDMERRTKGLLDRALPLFDGWPARGTVVDIGGGNGSLIREVLTRHPDLAGIVVDLPHVVPDATTNLQAAGLADRAVAMAGDFFVDVPSGHDVYVLANVLHDWADDAAAAILTTCRRAMRSSSRLVIFDAVLRPPNEPDRMKLYDLHMVVLVGGKERSEPEWAELLARANFELEQVIPSGALAWITARPVLRSEPT